MLLTFFLKCVIHGQSYVVVPWKYVHKKIKILKSMKSLAYSQMRRADEYSQHRSIIWPVWLNGWVFVYELSGCGFESSCSPWRGPLQSFWFRSKTGVYTCNLIKWEVLHRCFSKVLLRFSVISIKLGHFFYEIQFNGCVGAD